MGLGTRALDGGREGEADLKATVRWSRITVEREFVRR